MKKLISKRYRLEELVKVCDKLNFIESEVSTLEDSDMKSSSFWGRLFNVFSPRDISDKITPMNVFRYSPIKDMEFISGKGMLRILTTVAEMRDVLLKSHMVVDIPYVAGYKIPMVKIIPSDTIILEPSDDFYGSDLQKDGHEWLNIRSNCEDVVMALDGVESRLSRISKRILKFLNCVLDSDTVVFNADKLSNVDLVCRMFKHRSSYTDMMCDPNLQMRAMVILSTMLGKNSLTRSTLNNLARGMNSVDVSVDSDGLVDFDKGEDVAINISNLGTVYSSNVHTSTMGIIRNNSKNIGMAYASDVIQRASELIIVLRSVELTRDVVCAQRSAMSDRMNEEDMDLVATDISDAIDIIVSKGGKL